MRGTLATVGANQAGEESPPMVTWCSGLAQDSLKVLALVRIQVRQLFIVGFEKYEKYNFN